MTSQGTVGRGVAIGTDGAIAPLGTTFLAGPFMTAVAAAHSTDPVGRTHRRTWLWAVGGTVPEHRHRPA
ncbi:hypothetical protein [Streptomyces sp. NPDC093598]|uniref:hypothetical protein n=1 Tax=Streptomyces sp. NPDC093598 TaxID=3366046 RepID=UPI003803407A